MGSDTGCDSDAGDRDRRKRAWWQDLPRFAVRLWEQSEVCLAAERVQVHSTRGGRARRLAGKRPSRYVSRVSTTQGDLSLVVVAYHRPGSLDLLLAELDGSGTSIVVANVEGDLEIAEIGRRHGATLRAIEGNPGYAAAVNAGVELVETDFVVFSNDDVVLPAPSLEALAAVLRDKSADVAVPLVQDAGGSPVRTVQAAPGLGQFLLEWVLLPDKPMRLPGVHAQKWREPSGHELIDAASAMTIATSASLLRQHRLPETYGLYWEESEWFHWLKTSGHSVMYCPEAPITDLGGRAAQYPDKCRLLARNAVRYFRHTRGRAQAMVAWPLVMAWQLRLVATALMRVALGRPDSLGALRCRLSGLKAAGKAWSEIELFGTPARTP